MQNKLVLVSILLTVVLVSQLVGPSEANGRKPAREKSQSEPHATLKETEASANRALDNLERSVHQAAGDVSAGANRALQNLDDAIHDRKNKK